MVTRKVSEPVQDALKAYFELALGLTEASKKKAEKAVKKMAKELVGKGNATASQLQGAVEELVSTSSSNREAVTRLVRLEMDRALSRVGLATGEEVAVLTSRIEALERQLRDRQAADGTGASAAKPATVKSTTTASPTRKASVVKRAPVVKKAPTVKKATAAADVPVAPTKKAIGKAVKKAVKKTVSATETRP